MFILAVFDLLFSLGFYRLFLFGFGIYFLF
jgi:hypothetical protein